MFGRVVSMLFSLVCRVARGVLGRALLDGWWNLRDRLLQNTGQGHGQGVGDGQPRVVHRPQH